MKRLLLGILTAGTLIAAPPASEGRVISLSKPVKFYGALSVRMHPEEGKNSPPADMIVVSPSGKRTGLDPRTNADFLEIPDSWYGVEESSESEMLDQAVTNAFDMQNPPDGEYIIQVIGKEAGSYDIDAMGYSKEDKPADAQMAKVPICKDELQEYSLTFTKTPAATITIKRKVPANGQNDQPAGHP